MSCEAPGAERPEEEERTDQDDGRAGGDVEIEGEIEAEDHGQDRDEHTPSTIIRKNRAVRRYAVALGVTSMATTSTIPTAWMEITMVNATSDSRR